MKTIQFASTSTSLSEMCLGTMMFGDRCDEDESARILHKAMDNGVDFVDTAAAYAGGTTEEILGKIMKGRRDDLFISTKVTKNTDSDWIRQSLDESLTRLQTDRVDMFMIHWPREGMDTVAIMETLNSIVEAGKAVHIGCCNFPAWLVAHCNAIAAENGWAKLVSNQIPYNVIERGIEVEVLPQAQADDIAIMAYRPLLMGVLAGKYTPAGPIPEDSRGSGDKRIPDWLERFGPGLEQFAEFAAARDMHSAQLAVTWVRKSLGEQFPIVGVSSERQLQASLDAFATDLTDDEHETVTSMFDTAVKEESGGNFANLRRSTNLIA